MAESSATLWEMLYQAIYIPDGADPLPREIVNQPEISRYAQAWGKSDDLGFIAMDTGIQKPVGAVWIRLFCRDEPGYGYVDDATPEQCIAVLPEYRGCGVGSQLLAHLLETVKDRYPAISLSVSRDNPAARRYRRFGFKTVSKTADSLIMIRNLNPL